MFNNLRAEGRLADRVRALRLLGIRFAFGPGGGLAPA